MRKLIKRETIEELTDSRRMAKRISERVLARRAMTEEAETEEVETEEVEISLSNKENKIKVLSRLSQCNKSIKRKTRTRIWDNTLKWLENRCLK